MLFANNPWLWASWQISPTGNVRLVNPKGRNLVIHNPAYFPKIPISTVTQQKMHQKEWIPNLNPFRRRGGQKTHYQSQCQPGLRANEPEPAHSQAQNWRPGYSLQRNQA